MPVISIIVPVYKVEKYLKKCIESILAQSFQNFELILINDGSPDKCGEICDSFARVDSRIVVIHQHNKGISAVRNKGISIARGKYLAFVDGDDWVEPKMFEILLNNIEKTAADLSVCGMNIVYENQTNNMNSNNCIVDYEYNSMEVFRELFSLGDNVLPYVWNKLYKREVFRGVEFPEGYTYEDLFTIVEILSNCKKVHVTTKALYNYLQRENSITNSKFNEQEMNRIVAAKKNYLSYKMLCPEYIKNAEIHMCNQHFIVLDKMTIDPDMELTEEKKQVVKYLRKKIIFILGSRGFTLKRKLTAIGLFINYNVYAFLLKFK